MKRHLKTAILAPCVALLVAATLYAQGKPKAVVSEPIKEAGTIAKGEKIVHDFVIKNEGDAVLEITNVQAACGCTVAEFDKTIAPGQTGKVHTIVDTATFNGAIAKGVTVFTNDPDLPQTDLTIRAKVEPYIMVKPGYARFITVQGENKEGTVGQTLFTPDGSPLEIVKVDSPYTFLKTSFREAKAEERVPDVPGKQWRVEMTLANDAKVGALTEYVTVHTNHPKQKVVTIPVSGFIRPIVAVTPPVADFGTVELTAPLPKSLNVRNFATEPIEITGIEGAPAGIEAKLEPLEEGRQYQVKLTLKPEIGKGPFNGKLTLRTNSPKMPQIQVELKGTVL